MKKINYWGNFYKTFNESKPSDFAKSCEKEISNKKIIDVGCGNGRDALLFKQNGAEVIGVDLIDLRLNFLDRFINGIDELVKENIKSDVVYCRFIIHCIDEEAEDKLLLWAYENSKEIFIEVRSDNGTIENDNHFRRLINGEKLLSKLIKIGFKIEYYEKNFNFSIYENENPLLIRIKAKI